MVRDGAGTDTYEHYPRIRKSGTQLPLGISPYLWDCITPKIVVGAPEGALSRPSLVQGRRNAPTDGPAPPMALLHLDSGFGDAFRVLELPFDESPVQGSVLGIAVEHLSNSF